MQILMVYRMLLCLYPNDFRQQFAREMLEVFRQKTQDPASDRGPMFASFVLREFIGLAIGAAGAWIGRTMPKNKCFAISIPIISDRFPKPTAEEAGLSTSELQQRHDAVQTSMFQAAAGHDFATARSYEAEVARLQLFLNRRNRPRKSGATSAA
jgi:hypothetical protein